MKKQVALCVLFTLAVLGLQAQSVQSFVEQKQALPVLDGALWGGVATYVDHPQETLFALQRHVRLTPASTLKLVTTAAALYAFGPQHRFETKLYAQQLPDENGVLHGALYIQGGADPTLGSNRVTGAEKADKVLKKWVQAVQQAGITRIEGPIYADISAFEGPSISPKVNWENMGNYYAAPVSALSFNDNLFEIHFKAQPLPNLRTEVAYTVPELPEIEIENFVTTDGKSNKDNAYVYGAPGQYQLNIFGTIPTNRTGFSIKAALPDPALFTAQLLRRQLETKGIVVTGQARVLKQAPDYTGMVLLHTYYSSYLKDIVLIVNKRSFNLYADMLLRQLALRAGKKGSLQNGLDELQHFLQTNGLATDTDAVLYDGSGLARDNLITPQVLLNTLVFMAKSPYFKEYYTSLATPDDRGDLLVLRKFLKPQKRVEQVRLKGGTIDSVKAAAGYVKDKNGQLIAFVFMANNLASKDESLLRFHENIIKKLLALPEN